MMKKALVSILLVTFSAGLCYAQSPAEGSGEATSVDPNALLAKWNDGSISVREYVDWWKQLPENDRDTLETMDQKLRFLETMINARLVLAEAESLGLDKRPSVVEFTERRRMAILSDSVLSRAMKSADVDEDEVQRIFAEQRSQAAFRRIIVPTLDEAQSMMDSIAAGVPFEDLAMRYSSDVTGERGGYMGVVKPADLEPAWAREVFRLEAGEVSDPFFTDGEWAIVKVESRTEVEPANPDAEKARIRERLLSEAKMEEQKAYLDSLGTAYQVEFYPGPVVELCAAYATAIDKLGERAVVVDEDITPDLTEEQWQEPLATYRGGKFTTRECVNSILARPYPARPTLDDPEQMMAFVYRDVKDTLIVHEAKKIGIADSPAAVDEVDKIRRRRLALNAYQYITADAEVPPDVMRAFYREHEDLFILPLAWDISKIVVESRAAADSVMALLEAGEPFEDIARTRSIDRFTAPRGGRVGLLAEGQDKEFEDQLENMKVGDVRYFRSLEGHVILKLNRKQEPRKATFEEASSTIYEKLINEYKEKRLAEWLASQREKRGLEIFEANLEPLLLFPL
jgi:parvulin-like peptidyl-prolyl isomerase